MLPADALALAGAALNAGLYSLMNVILVSSQDTLDRFRFWQVGSVAGRQRLAKGRRRINHRT